MHADGPEPSNRGWWTTIVYIASVAMLLRFYDLPLKPLHHDEGVNAFFLTRLIRPPHSYQYDPANYHGPSLYYFAWLSVSVLGLNTIAIRVVTALGGLATVLLLTLFKRHIGRAGALSAAALLAVSPGAVYFSRYFIHEMLLVAFSVATVIAAMMWWQRGRAWYLYLAAISGGLMYATKETAIISTVVLLAALFGVRLVCGGWPSHPASRPSPLLALSALGVFLAVNLLLYTSLFTRWQGAIDVVNTFAFWTRTAGADHTQPWYAYLQWLSMEELPLLVLGSAGAAWAVWRRDNRFAVFAAFWAAGVLAAYSVIPYKTPWLTLNIIAPLALTAGYACEQLWRHRQSIPRAAAAGVVVLAIGTSALQSVTLNFLEYDNARYPYVYSHTSRDMLGLVQEIDRIQKANPGARITVTSRAQFPLSWYLRNYRAGYYSRVTVTGAPVVVASEQQRTEMDAALGERYQQVGSYRLRPGVRLVLYVRRDLARS